VDTRGDKSMLCVRDITEPGGFLGVKRPVLSLGRGWQDRLNDRTGFAIGRALAATEQERSPGIEACAENIPSGCVIHGVSSIGQTRARGLFIT